MGFKVWILAALASLAATSAGAVTLQATFGGSVSDGVETLTISGGFLYEDSDPMLPTAIAWDDPRISNFILSLTGGPSAFTFDIGSITGTGLDAAPFNLQTATINAQTCLLASVPGCQPNASGHVITFVNGTALYNALSGNNMSGAFTFSVEEVAAVPLPAGIPLFLTGLGAIGAFRLRRRQS